MVVVKANSAGTTGNYDTDGGAAQNHHGGNVNEKWQVLNGKMHPKYE